MVELEAIAVRYAIKKCHMYLAGLPHFTIITDHRPLIPIFNKKGLAEIENMKLQNIKAELQSRYIFTTEWRQGKDHAIADALSRAPVDDAPEEDEMENLKKRVIQAIRVATIEEEGFLEGDENSTEAITDPIIEDLRKSARTD